jgi:hypothetical protein
MQKQNLMNVLAVMVSFLIVIGFFHHWILTY